MKEIRLSQCMIVKNEEENIKKALSWGKGIVCEQIVVDTGSSDNTVKIAKEMGATVYHFPWINDFSAAKNFAIEKAKGNWIAFLDADEYFSEDDAKKIIPYLREVEKHSSYIENKMGGKADVISCPCVNLNDKGQPFSVVTFQRIFRNVPRIRYTGMIHETLAAVSGSKLVYIDAEDSFSVFHTGYKMEVYDKTDKAKRNLELLLKELEATPGNPNAYAYLADSYYALNDLEEAENCCRKAIANKSMGIGKELLLSAHQRLLQILHTKEGVTKDTIWEAYKSAIKEDPGHPDFDFFYGTYLLMHDDWQEGVSYLETALDKSEKYRSRTNIIIHGSITNIYNNIGVACSKMNDLHKAVKYFTLSLRLDKNQPNVLCDLLTKLSTGVNPAPAMDILNFLSQIYDFSKELDLYIIYKCSDVAKNEELKKLVYPFLSDDRKKEIKDSNNKSDKE